MYRLTSDENTVMDLTDTAFIPLGSDRWLDYQAWLKKGNTPEPESQPTPEQKLALDTAAFESEIAVTEQVILQVKNRIEDLQSAIDGKYASEEETSELAVQKQKLPVWKRYRFELSRVDISDPVWPEKPTA